MFKLINAQGFELTFENGCSVMVRIGAGVGDHAAIADDVPDAEKAVMDVNGDIRNSRALVTIQKKNHTISIAEKTGSVTPEQLLEILKHVAIKKK